MDGHGDVITAKNEVELDFNDPNESLPTQNSPSVPLVALSSPTSPGGLMVMGLKLFCQQTAFRRRGACPMPYVLESQSGGMNGAALAWTGLRCLYL